MRILPFTGNKVLQLTLPMNFIVNRNKFKEKISTRDQL